MKIGVSTACFYPLETEKSLARLGALHLPAAEVFINADQELEPAFCRQLRRRADAMGVELISLHPYTSGFEPFLFFSNYPRRFEDGREYYKKIHQAAAILGAKLVVFHGGRRSSSMELEEYARRFAILSEDARAQGVVLAHENVERCTGHTPEFFQGLLDILPSAAYVLDVKQAVRSGYTPYEMAKAMGKGVRHLHLSDHGEDGDCLPIGRGELNLPLLWDNVENLAGVSMVLELYRTNFAEDGELYTSYKRVEESFIGV